MKFGVVLVRKIAIVRRSPHGERGLKSLFGWAEDNWLTVAPLTGSVD